MAQFLGGRSDGLSVHRQPSCATAERMNDGKALIHPAFPEAMEYAEPVAGRHGMALDELFEPAGAAALAVFRRRRTTSSDWFWPDLLGRGRQAAAWRGLAFVDPGLVDIGFRRWKGRSGSDPEAAYSGALQHEVHLLSSGESSDISPPGSCTHAIASAWRQAWADRRTWGVSG
mgnify:CR=1 FL=1